MNKKEPPCDMAELLAILNIEAGHELKDGWREVKCPFHYEKRKEVVFYVNCEFNSWNCYHACPGCPGVGRNNGIVLTLYMLFTGVADRAEAAKQIKERRKDGELPRRMKAMKDKKSDDVPKAQLAEIEVRNKTYNALLDMLTLAPKHRRDLCGRGLNDVQINRLGYKSVPVMGKYSIAKKLMAQGCVLTGVPGFYTDKQGQPMGNFGRPGFFIPVRDIHGRIQFLQIRHDETEQKDNADDGLEKKRKPPKYTNFSSSSSKLMNGVGVPYVAHFVGFPADGSIPARISMTEGYLKSDISSVLTETPFIGFGGTTCYSLFFEVFTFLKEGGMQEAWECMDKDRTLNNNVMDDIKEQMRIAQEIGVPYKPYPWDPRYKGVDDFLAARNKIRQGHVVA